MPTENKPAPFEREERYIVLKLNRLAKDETEYLRDCQSKAMVECLVIESDWPEYEPAWQMIERRMTGQAPVTAAEELEAVLYWRKKHADRLKTRDALQQRLTAADERNDVAIDLLQRTRAVIEGGGWADLEPDIASFFKPAENRGDE